MSRNKPQKVVYSAENEVDMEIYEIRVSQSLRTAGSTEARKGDPAPSSAVTSTSNSRDEANDEVD